MCPSGRLLHKIPSGDGWPQATMVLVLPRNPNPGAGSLACSTWEYVVLCGSCPGTSGTARTGVTRSRDRMSMSTSDQLPAWRISRRFSIRMLILTGRARLVTRLRTARW
jgi:hypothetical protein